MTSSHAITTVLLTRPHGSNAGLATQLAVLGVRCVELPMLNIVDLAETNDIDCARRQLSVLSQGGYDYALFVSANAVNAASRFIQQHRIAWPGALPCLGMGATTEAAIAANGWALKSMIGGMHGNSLTSEQMLGLPWAQQVAGRRIAIIKGQGGRTVLATTLAERGATVDSLSLYRREPPEYSDDALHVALQAVIQHPQSSVIVAASSETLEHIAAALARVGATTLATTLKANVHCVVPSQRLRARAQALGFSSVGVASGAGDEAFFDCIAGYMRR